MDAYLYADMDAYVKYEDMDEYVIYEDMDAYAYMDAYVSAG